jgi:hypothetical protein
MVADADAISSSYNDESKEVDFSQPRTVLDNIWFCVMASLNINVIMKYPFDEHNSKCVSLERAITQRIRELDSNAPHLPDEWDSTLDEFQRQVTQIQDCYSVQECLNFMLKVLNRRIVITDIPEQADE